MVHIDDWVDEVLSSPRLPSDDDGRCYAALFFWYARLNAAAKTNISLVKGAPEMRLFCLYRGQRYRVTGASRMGDVWLARDLSREHGYDYRVEVTDCHDWSALP